VTGRAAASLLREVAAGVLVVATRGAASALLRAPAAGWRGVVVVGWAAVWLRAAAAGGRAGVAAAEVAREAARELVAVVARETARELVAVVARESARELAAVVAREAARELAASGSCLGVAAADDARDAARAALVDPGGRPRRGRAPSVRSAPGGPCCWCGRNVAGSSVTSVTTLLRRGASSLVLCLTPARASAAAMALPTPSALARRRTLATSLCDTAPFEPPSMVRHKPRAPSPRQPLEKTTATCSFSP
jgi:hypothetical protein